MAGGDSERAGQHDDELPGEMVEPLTYEAEFVDPISAPGRTAERRVASRKNAARKARRKTILLTAGIALVVALVAVAIMISLSSDPGASVRAEDFTEAWNAGDRRKVAGMLHEAGRQSDLEELDRKLMRRGWSLGEPRIEEGQAVAPKKPRPDREIYRHPTKGGEVRSVWRKKGEVWWLIDIGFSELRPGMGPEGTVENLCAALNAHDTARVCEMAPESFRPKLKRFMVRLEDRRSRSPSSDAGGVRRGARRILGPGRLRQDLEVEDETLRVTFEYRHPKWHLVSMRTR